MNDLEKRLLVFARRLHSIEDFGEMVSAMANEIRESVGYSTAWLAVFEVASGQVRILAVVGEGVEDIWEHAPAFPIKDDPYMVRIFEATEPQIVADAS